MASEENLPVSPKSPRSKHPRASLTGLFEGLNMENSTSPATKDKGKGRSERPGTQDSEASGHSSLRGSLSQRWPPAFGEFDVRLKDPLASSARTSSPSVTLRMSDSYRISGDNWARDRNVKDEPADRSEDFGIVQVMMDEIHNHVNMLQENRNRLAGVMMEEMANVIYGSNQKARKGLGLDETHKICHAIFEGDGGIEYRERTPEYQAKLEKLILQGMDAGSNHVIRSRTEVVQHAAAFHHLVSSFVTDDKPMSEDLIKATHAILVKDIGRGTAGFLSNKEHGGLYRTENVYVGAKQLPKPSTIPIAMQSMVRKLETDLVEAREKKYLDPFALAAEYCDRLVNIHPFRDGNGRMCRLILNAILIKYAGIVVNVGEHDQSRDEYIAVAQESHEVGGHAGALSTMVLAEAKKTLKRMKNKLTIKKEI